MIATLNLAVNSAPQTHDHSFQFTLPSYPVPDSNLNHSPSQRKQIPSDRSSSDFLQTRFPNMTFPALMYIKKGGDPSPI